jgi:hypothetical protein
MGFTPVPRTGGSHLTSQFTVTGSRQAMSNDKRSWFMKSVAKIAVALLACLSVVFANAAAADAQKSPEAVATEFYSWYVKTIEANHDPMTDYPAELSAYVSKPLIEEVRRAMSEEDGLEADYFIQAQDYLDDWSANVRATKSKIHGNTATLELILGASPETRQRLALTLIREQQHWKIRNVRPLQ